MKISQKLISGILGIATLSVITGAINAHQQLKIAKYIAQQEAEEVAGLLGYFVSHELEYHEIGSRDKMLAELQEHVTSLHKKRQRDLEIVDMYFSTETGCRVCNCNPDSRGEISTIINLRSHLEGKLPPNCSVLPLSTVHK